MITIDPRPLDIMRTDAEATFPDECCGFFFGREEENKTVTEAITVNNSKEGDKRRRFQITPQDYLKAERYADEHEVQLLGVYHSHPSHPAIPSETDRAAAQPYFSYIILSVMNAHYADIRSWVLNEDGQFIEEQLHFK